LLAEKPKQLQIFFSVMGKKAYMLCGLKMRVTTLISSVKQALYAFWFQSQNNFKFIFSFMIFKGIIRFMAENTGQL
jgi:hypothetical protein